MIENSENLIITVVAVIEVTEILIDKIQSRTVNFSNKV